MLLTVIFFALLAIVAFGLRAPLSPLRITRAAIGGLVLGGILAYLNVYPGSIRAAVGLFAVALIASGLVVRRGMQVTTTRPLIPRLPLVGGILVLLLLAGALFPYTSWGAKSVDEKIYNDLNMNEVTTAAPAVPAAKFADVRVVPLGLASQLLTLDYGADASFLDTSPALLERTTYPDTVNGEFVWVHAPAPETSKWLLGGRLAGKVLYVRNDAGNLTPDDIPGTLNVHVDGIYWQHRVARYAENAGEFRYALQDVTLQLDDAKHPYWIAYLVKIDLRSQPHLEKLLVVDANTGAESDYAPQDAPAWIEQVYPETYVYEWAQYWGLHREGLLYRWFNANRLVEPDDVTVRYIRLENSTYWLLPMKQLRSAQLGGYILIDTRTGNATFYDRFDASLIDYDTAHAQLQAIMASGSATQGAGSIRLAISEGYLYPIRMGDGTVRDAYIFPLLEGLKVSRFAIIDAHDYTTKRVFGTSIEDALRAFASDTGSSTLHNATETLSTTVRVIDGTINGQRAVVDLNGTFYAITTSDLSEGRRHEPEREMDELSVAVARASRGQSVSIDVLILGGRVVDVTYADVTWP